MARRRASQPDYALSHVFDQAGLNAVSALRHGRGGSAETTGEPGCFGVGVIRAARVPPSRAYEHVIFI